MSLEKGLVTALYSGWITSSPMAQGMWSNFLRCHNVMVLLDPKVDK